jgi:predicted AAA+ superfamily ATPase
MVLKRRLDLDQRRSYLLLGPRRVGKSTFLKTELKPDVLIDLLMSDVYFDYRSRPSLIRERYAHMTGTIVIDEVQRVPELVSEVHWMLENTKVRFVLSGSSARRLRQEGTTNLAGRLRTQRMAPLTWQECRDVFVLEDRLQYGMLPPIVFSDDPSLDLKDYCGEYLKEEVQSEGLVRNLPAFTRFLEMAAFNNAELLNYATVARDCGVSAKTVAEYYQILEDTLLGFFLEPFTKTRKRRATQTRKFYYFDCGVSNTLLGRRLSPRTPEFGKVFEQWLVLEAFHAAFYERRIEHIQFWRSSGGLEVDLLLNESTAVEFKSGRVHDADAQGILALAEDIPLKNKWIVSREEIPRMLACGVEVLPWQDYLTRLAYLD